MALWLHRGHDEDVWERDIQTGEHAMRLFPAWREVARLERAFADSAVRYCLRQGVRQFLVIGCGHPVAPTVHQIAAAQGHPSRCVYVDPDPTACAHRLHDIRTTGVVGLHAVVQADLRASDYVWRQAVSTTPSDTAGSPIRLTEDRTVTTTAVLDPGQAIAVVLPWVLPFITRDTDLRDALADITARMPTGSLLIATHTTTHDVPRQQARQLAGLRDHLAASGIPMTYRGPEQLAGLFAEMTLVDPGITWIPVWLGHDEIAEPWAGSPSMSCTVAAIARKA